MFCGKARLSYTYIHSNMFCGMARLHLCPLLLILLEDWVVLWLPGLCSCSVHNMIMHDLKQPVDGRIIYVWPVGPRLTRSFNEEHEKPLLWNHDFINSNGIVFYIKPKVLPKSCCNSKSCKRYCDWWQRLKQRLNFLHLQLLEQLVLDLVDYTIWLVSNNYNVELGLL